MSHHYSGPDFRFPQGDARLDLTDLYAFPKPGDTPFRTSSTKPRGAGQRRRIPTSSITISSTKVDTSRRGNSRSFSFKK
jgi:hypothetical protein